VRNLDDGRVETIAEGDAEKLNEFLAFLHQGPTGAWVMGVEEEWLPPLGDFTDFKITY
jgi:acylphosphatase